MQLLHEYVKKMVEVENGPVIPDTPLFRSSRGRRHEGNSQDRNLELVRGLFGHARIETTQVYAQIPAGAVETIGELLRGARARRTHDLKQKHGLCVSGTFRCSSKHSDGPMGIRTRV
jgi:hypothetical protein